MSRFTRFAAVLAASLAALAWAAAPAVAGANTTFSGRATVLQGSIAGVPIPCLASVNNPSLVPQSPSSGCRGVGDTGEVAASGGHLEASLLCYPGSNDPSCVLAPQDLTEGALNARALHAAVVSHGKTSTAEASVADFSVTAGGQTISGSLLYASAQATCNNGVVSVSTQAQVATLSISSLNGGAPIIVTGEKNQPVGLPGGGTVTLNEFSPFTRADGDQGATVNALHIQIPATVVGGIVTVPATDIIVAQATADIACGVLVGCPNGHSFVTGGGWINDKANFAVAGRNTLGGAAPWGHVLYKPGGVHAKDPVALAFWSDSTVNKVQSDLAGFPELADANGYLSTLAGGTKVEGGAILAFTYVTSAGSNANGEVLVLDLGEPGNLPKGHDFFEIVGVGGTPIPSAAGNFLGGGNIQMHGKC